jgi:hypothetical protein
MNSSSLQNPDLNKNSSSDIELCDSAIRSILEIKAGTIPVIDVSTIDPDHYISRIAINDPRREDPRANGLTEAEALTVEFNPLSSTLPSEIVDYLGCWPRNITWVYGKDSQNQPQVEVSYFDDRGRFIALSFENSSALNSFVLSEVSRIIISPPQKKSALVVAQQASPLNNLMIRHVHSQMMENGGPNKKEQKPSKQELAVEAKKSMYATLMLPQIVEELAIELGWENEGRLVEMYYAPNKHSMTMKKGDGFNYQARAAQSFSTPNDIYINPFWVKFARRLKSGIVGKTPDVIPFNVDYGFSTFLRVKDRHGEEAVNNNLILLHNPMNENYKIRIVDMSSSDSSLLGYALNNVEQYSDIDLSAEGEVMERLNLLQKAGYKRGIEGFYLNGTVMQNLRRFVGEDLYDAIAQTGAHPNVLDQIRERMYQQIKARIYTTVVMQCPKLIERSVG